MFFLAQNTQAMKSESYEIQNPWPDFAPPEIVCTPGVTEPATSEITCPQGTTESYFSGGYQIYKGYWYIKNESPFRFFISDSKAVFGNLSAGAPTLKTLNLTISAEGVGGYQVSAGEDHELAEPTTQYIIPNTTGDNGDISQENPGLWQKNTTYGLGYSLSGDDVPNAFSQPKNSSSFYKQFANLGKEQPGKLIMSSQQQKTKTVNTNIIYKLNTAATQPPGNYQNTIIYTAIPTY